jgi:rhodanese-related sulfurtransferase
MKKLAQTLVLLLIFAVSLSAQVQNPKFKKRINFLLSESVPFITVDELKGNTEDYYILDAREPEEYKVSHIPGAVCIGYDDLDYSVLQDIPKDKKIVVYCSIGYRSEKVGEKLMKKGFMNVQNLYGSIFEWSNRGFPVYDENGETTAKVHAYNKRWSKWIDNPKVEKVW